jgi:hypothetical protein
VNYGQRWSRIAGQLHQLVAEDGSDALEHTDQRPAARLKEIRGLKVSAEELITVKPDSVH